MWPGLGITSIPLELAWVYHNRGTLVCNQQLANVCRRAKQSSRRSERSGKLARRRRRTNGRPKRSARALPLCPPMARTPPMGPPRPATNSLAGPSNSRPSATNPARRSLASTRPRRVVCSSCRSTATTIFNILATQLRRTALPTRCTVNVNYTLTLVSRPG